MLSSDAIDLALEALHYKNAEGLVQRHKSYDPDGRGFVWRELREKGQLDAAYFRGSIPLIGFARAKSSAELPSIHRRLWNLSRVPLLIAGTADEAAVYSCFTPPGSIEADSDVARLRQAHNLEEIPSVLLEFSRFHVESGDHARRYPDRFRREGRVDVRLLNNLRALRGSLLTDTNKDEALDALIGRAMFVRYLEDRRILTKQHVEEWAPGNQTFISILQRGVGATYQFFSRLAERFNGDIFVFDEIESKLVTAPDLDRIAQFFSGSDVPSGQQSFFPYDFSVIPSELISSIYEQLLEGSQERDAAYYTPRPAVDLVLDELLPWETSTTSLRVLDPACGSGIFLAETFRRLAFLLKSIGRGSFPELVHVLTKNIFGVDRNPAAVRVAAFGLYLGILEELDPPNAWREARLPPLIGRNLFSYDFFDRHPLTDERFDLVVGNPPWQSQLSSKARSYVQTSEVPVADLQIAFAFLWRAGDMLTDDGRLGLLMPARPFLHNKGKAIDVRREVLDRFTIETIIDLTGLRRGLFHQSISPACVVVGHPNRQELRASNQPDLLHVAPRLSPLQMSIDGFVVSQKDVHRVPAALAETSPDVWKTLLRGDERDIDVIRKLRQRFPPLAEIAKKRRWVGPSRGITFGGGKQVPVPSLVGRLLVPGNAIVPFGLKRDGLAVLDRAAVERPRDERLFSAPHILVKRTLWRGRPAAVMLNEDAVFRDVVIGIAGPHSDRDLLRLLTAYMNSSVWSYYHFLTSGSWGVERSTIEAIEQMTFPFATPGRDIAAGVLSVAERAEHRQHLTDISWQQDLDDAVFEAYALSEQDRIFIKDVVAIGIDAFDRTTKSAAFNPPDSSAVRRYCDRLKRSLPNGVRSLVHDIRAHEDLTPPYLLVSISLAGKSRTASESVARFDSVIREVDATVSAWTRPATILQPSVIVLDEQTVHFVKPNELRYWTLSEAITDAAELVAALATSPSSAAGVKDEVVPVG